MIDYHKLIPNGDMMIRDVGNGWVEFWFKTSSPTFNHQQPWGYAANGSFTPGQYDLVKGGNWQMLGAVFVSVRQDVMFRIDDSGLGWGTTEFWQFIERMRPPDPPSAPYFFERTTDSIHVQFDWGYDGGPYLGGGSILEAELWASYDLTPRFLHQNTKDTWFTGLSPKTRYYFWGKYRNAAGWSDFGTRSEAWTIGVPDTPQPPNISAVSPVRAQGAFRDPYPWDGGSQILEYQIGYGTDPNGPQALVSNTQFDKSDLLPGRQYYFWARARNAIGWSAWSWRTDVLLPAGALVRVGGEHKRALVWVKEAGVWKITRVWTKAGDTWKGTAP